MPTQRIDIDEPDRPNFKLATAAGTLLGYLNSAAITESEDGAVTVHALPTISWFLNGSEVLPGAVLRRGDGHSA